jgi:WD40 repeat protein
LDAESLKWLTPQDVFVNLTILPAFSPDSVRVAFGWADGKVRVWDLKQTRYLFPVSGPPVPCCAAQFSPDGGRLAVGWENGQVWLIDTATGRDERLRGPAERAATWIEFRPADELLFCESVVLRFPVSPEPGTGAVRGMVAQQRPFVIRRTPSRITARDRAGGEHTVVDLGKEVRNLSFSPDGGKAVAIHAGREVCAWDLRTGEVLACIPVAGGPLSTPVFSGDGEFLAVGTSSGDVLVWRLGRPEPLFTLKGHQEQVVAVGFSPDGRRLVSAGAFGLVKMWDLTLGQEVLTLSSGSLVSSGLVEGATTLRGHDPPLAAVRFSANGRRLFVGDEISKGRLWSAMPPGLQQP